VKVCFLVQELLRSGGVQVILGHANRLARAHRGIEPEIVVIDAGAPRLVDSPDVPVWTLEEVDGTSYDLAIATWWETATFLDRIQADRHAAFVQSLEQRFYLPEEWFDKLAALAVYALPVDFIAVSGWMRDLLSELRPDVRCFHVPNGIDKRVFSARDRERRDGPLRVLVEGQRSLWFKGVEDAERAVRGMHEPAELIHVSLSPDDLSGLEFDRALSELSPGEMADVYANADVLLKLSRVEGLGLPPLEAFHLGVPCVVTPFTGHDEFVVHEENGIVVGFDDVEGTTAWLDLLAADRDFLARLSEGALATAKRWPDEETSTRMFATALEELVAGPRPRAEAALPRLLNELWLRSELGRIDLAEALGSLEWHVEALADARAALAEREAQVEEINASRAYRTAVQARRVVKWFRR
jgi:O-antigen biosynthesis protein